MNKKYCNWCKQYIEYEKQQEWASHRGNCKQNPNITLKYKKISKSCTLPRHVYKFNCKKCDKEYKLEITENDYKKGKYKKHCSRSCANSRVWLEEDKRKKSYASKNSKKVLEVNRKAAKERIGKERKNKIPLIKTLCLYCNDPIIHKKNVKRKYHKECWLKCSGGYRINSTCKHRSIYKGYQMDSSSEESFAILFKWK